jgi:spermidine/putrescine transport system substrate-binding protein
MHTRLSRRDFMKIAGGAAAGFALSSAFPLPAFAQSARRAKELNILCWEGYNSDNVLNPFRALHKGIELKAESGTDDPSMINKLRAGEIKVWDLINLNQCWARQQMWGEKLIKPISKERFMPYIEKMMPMFYNKTMGVNPFALSPDGTELIGMMQRFGPMNFVINTKKISIATAEDEGLPMFLDPKMKGKFGLLAWDNWNVLHMCVASGFTPYKMHTPEEVEAFKKTAQTLFTNAKMISGDPAQLNQALINGEIDAIFSGGTYTCSARAPSSGSRSPPSSTTPTSARSPKTSSNTSSAPTSATPSPWPTPRTTPLPRCPSPRSSPSLPRKSSTASSGRPSRPT